MTSTDEHEHPDETTLDGLGRPTHAPDGTDLTLIRGMLALTPIERLRRAQSLAASLLGMRRAAGSR